MNEERAQDALQHLQTAAVEMIEATRAALEVVEDIVRDPAVLAGLFASVQAMAHGAAQAAQGERRDGERRSGASHEPTGAASDDQGAGRGNRVTRIPVS